MVLVCSLACILDISHILSTWDTLCETLLSAAHNISWTANINATATATVNVNVNVNVNVIATLINGHHDIPVAADMIAIVILLRY